MLSKLRLAPPSEAALEAAFQAADTNGDNQMISSNPDPDSDPNPNPNPSPNTNTNPNPNTNTNPNPNP